MLWAHRDYDRMPRFIPDKLSMLKRKNWLKVSPHLRNYLYLIPAMKGKISFLKWKIIGHVRHTAQHKTDSMWFCVLLVCLVSFVLLFVVVVIVCFNFHFFGQLLIKEKKWSSTSRKLGRILEELRKDNMLKRYCMKIFK